MAWNDRGTGADAAGAITRKSPRSALTRNEQNVEYDQAVMRPTYIPSQYRCCKCGNVILRETGWCDPCKMLLGMIPRDHCLTCTNPVKPGAEFCAGCMKAKRAANGEYRLEAMWARPYRY